MTSNPKGPTTEPYIQPCNSLAVGANSMNDESKGRTFQIREGFPPAQDGNRCRVTMLNVQERILETFYGVKDAFIIAQGPDAWAERVALGL